MKSTCHLYAGDRKASIAVIPPTMRKSLLSKGGGRGKKKQLLTSEEHVMHGWCGSLVSRVIGECWYVTAVGHYPWFMTYNFLNDVLPLVDKTAEGGVDPNMV